MNRVFFYPDFSRYVFFTSSALAHMYKWSQRAPWQKEAGGELFTPNPNDDGLIITTTKGPQKEDYRARRAFNPDATAGYCERQRQFEHGLYPVGLWHTHPEKYPTPSGLDRETTEAYFKALEGEYRGYLMVIVGSRGKVPELCVWEVRQAKSPVWIRLLEENAHALKRYL